MFTTFSSQGVDFSTFLKHCCCLYLENLDMERILEMEEGFLEDVEVDILTRVRNVSPLFCHLIFLLIAKVSFVYQSKVWILRKATRFPGRKLRSKHRPIVYSVAHLSMILTCCIKLAIGWTHWEILLTCWLALLWAHAQQVKEPKFQILELISLDINFNFFASSDTSAGFSRLWHAEYDRVFRIVLRQIVGGLCF